MNSSSDLPSSPAHPFLELCLHSDLLDIEVTPSGDRGAFLAGVSAKTLAGSARVYSLSLRYGVRGVDTLPSARDKLWVSVDGKASEFDIDGTDYGTTLDGLPDGDREDVIEAVHRLYEIHGTAGKIVTQFLTHAQGHVYSLLNGLAAQAGAVYPEGAGEESWHDALEGFVKLCRTPGLQGVRLSASAEGVSLVDAFGRVEEPLTGTTFEVAVSWAPGDGRPLRRVSVDDSALDLAGGAHDLGSLFQGAPQASRDGLAEVGSRLLKMADLAGEVVAAHQLGAPAAGGSTEEVASYLLDVQRVGSVSGGALDTLNGLARLHTGG